MLYMTKDIFVGATLVVALSIGQGQALPLQFKKTCANNNVVMYKRWMVMMITKHGAGFYHVSGDKIGDEC